MRETIRKLGLVSAALCMVVALPSDAAATETWKVAVEPTGAAPLYPAVDPVSGSTYVVDSDGPSVRVFS